MDSLTLSSIAPELIKRLEDSELRDSERVVTDFFVELAKRNEMANQGEVRPEFYHALSSAVKREVLPIYRTYEQRTSKIKENQRKRSIIKYMVIGAGACIVVETAITRGRGLLPQISIPVGLVGSMMGLAAYGLTQVAENAVIGFAKDRLFANIKSLDTRVLVDAEYSKYREGKDGDLLNAEAVEVLEKYRIPERFWKDYIKVRNIDPTCKEDLREAQLAEQFEPFYLPHIGGEFSKEARQQRFNKLALLAHQSFTLRDPEYPLKYAQSIIGGNEK